MEATKDAARIIYCGSRNQYEVIVDEAHYAYLVQWAWNFVRSRGGNIYARRTAKRSRGKGGFTLLMHVVIMELKGEPRPSPKHTPDHINGDTLDNRGSNLRWATKKEQAANRRRVRHIGPRAELNIFEHNRQAGQVSTSEIPF